MLKLFLSYARADGVAAAVDLRARLTRSGYTVWRDLDEMRGGAPWRQQLFDALQAVDAVLVLLTPGAVASEMVTWEWQTAQGLRQRIIPLLVSPCEAPPELARLNYHNLHDPALLGFESLQRDLRELEQSLTTKPPTTYDVDRLVDGAMGDGALVDNRGAPARPPTRRVVPEPSGAGYHLGEGERTAVGQGATALNAGGGQQAAILSHYTQQTERRLIARVTTLLDQQQQATVATMLNAVQAEHEALSDALTVMLTRLMARVRLIQQSPALRQQQPELAQQTAEALAIIEDPHLTPRHRLKVTLPIVPLLLAYEAELELEQSGNLAAAWADLKRRLGL